MSRARSFLDRFVHPRLAAVALFGAGLWLLSFFIAASGLAMQAFQRWTLMANLFFTASLVGLLGMFILGLSGLYLVGLWVLRYVRGAGEGRAA